MNELRHVAQLMPLAALIALRLVDHRKPPPEWWLVAAAFAVSWVGDSIAFYDGGTFRGSFFWLPVQVGLVLLAFPPKRGAVLAWSAVVAAALVVLATASARLSWPGPEWLVTVVGSVAILASVRGPLRVPVWVYWCLGSVAYFRYAGTVVAGDVAAEVARTRDQMHLSMVVAYAAFLGLALWAGRTQWPPS